MLAQVAGHSIGIVCLLVLLEDVGLPLLVPTDLLVIAAGAMAGSWATLMWWWGLLCLASAIGSSGLFALIRLGGRPLLARVGPVLHMQPAHLARAEGWLRAAGWRGIVLGCATPGLRYVTRIACALLAVPYLRYLSAHVLGSAAYLVCFLGIGAVFGVAVGQYLQGLHLGLWLPLALIVVVGVPVLVRRRRLGLVSTGRRR
jgi:membrane protein DedA with SNARE-associated domain